MFDEDEEIFLIGEWLYDGKVPTLVAVVRTSSDYYFVWDQNDGRETWEPYSPAEDGFYYYVRAAGGDLLGSPPFQDVEAAKKWADQQP